LHLQSDSVVERGGGFAFVRRSVEHTLSRNRASARATPLSKQGLNLDWGSFESHSRVGIHFSLMCYGLFDLGRGTEVTIRNGFCKEKKPRTIPASEKLFNDFKLKPGLQAKVRNKAPHPEFL